MSGAVLGGCLCGRVRYRAEGDPLFAVLCHCRQCQLASGGGHLPVLGMPRQGFSVEGGPRQFAHPGGSGSPTRRHFCPDCGSTLFGMPDAYPEMVTLYVGTLDDPSIFHPNLSSSSDEAQPWDRLLT